jgi:hypothetical protein
MKVIEIGEEKDMKMRHDDASAVLWKLPCFTSMEFGSRVRTTIIGSFSYTMIMCCVTFQGRLQYTR